MQAWYTPQKIAIRVKQAQQMKAFIVSQQIPPDEPVVLAGDFNDDMVRYPGSVATLLSTLNASMPPLDGEIQFTSSPSSNVLVGRDGAADECRDQYEKSWGPEDSTATHSPTLATRVARSGSWPPKTDTGAAVLPFFTNPGNLSYCPCCPQEWLDYILLSNTHQQPSLSKPAATLSALKLKDPVSLPMRVPWSGAMQPVPEPPVVGSWLNLQDLSDHYPVVSNFWFDYMAPPVLGIDGCGKDSDCNIHASIHGTCYCDGPGCYYDGKKVNGWTSRRRDPVNNNCHLALFKCICHKGDVDPPLANGTLPAAFA